MMHAEEQRDSRDGHSLYLVVPPNASFARTARNRMSGFVRDCAIPEIDAFDFLTAFGEALANAIEHAQSRDVEVTCRIVGTDELVATVIDSGIGFHIDTATLERSQLAADVRRTRTRLCNHEAMHRRNRRE